MMIKHIRLSKLKIGHAQILRVDRPNSNIIFGGGTGYFQFN